MTSTTLRILLVGEREVNDRLIGDRLNRVKTYRFQLDWVPTCDLALTAIDYDIYLIDFSAANDGLSFLQVLRKNVGPAPIILLVDTPQLGMAALEFGADDYLEKSQLGSAMLERSLRLTLAASQAREALSRCEENLSQLLAFKALAERLQAVIETAGEGITLGDRSGNFEIFNSKMKEITGYTREQANNCNDFWLQLDPDPDEHGTAVETIKQAIETGESRQIETKITAKDGTQRTLSVSTSLVRDRSRDWVLTVCRDLSDRQRVEAELLQSKRFVEMIADTTPQLLYVYDLITHCNIYVNRQIVEILGYTPQEVRQGGTQFFLDNFHPDDLHYINEESARFATVGDGETLESEFRMKHANGSWRWLRSRDVVFARTADGSPAQILGTAADITERKLVEMQLLESQSRLRAIVNSTSDSILIVDRRGIVRFANPAAATLFRKPLSDLLDREFGEPIVNSNSANLCIAYPNGELAIGEMRVAPAEWSGESVYVVSLRDITDCVKARDALRDSERRFRQIAETIQDIFWLFSPETDELLYVSPACEKILGCSCQMLYAERDRWLNAIAPPDRERFLAAGIQQRLGNSTTIEYRIATPSGEIRWICDRAFPIKNELGKVYRVAGVAEDITEEKSIQAEQLRQTQYQHLLTAVTLKIRESLQIEEILQTTVTQLQKTVGADRVLFWRLLPDGSGNVVSEAAVPGFPAMLGLVIEDECMPRQYLEKYRRGGVRIDADVSETGVNGCYLDFLQRYRIRANLVVPILLNKSKLWGVLSVQQCSRTRKWTTVEIDLMQQIADHVSIALYQAQLLERETRRRQELARSNAELEQFAYAASHDLQAPLRTIASYAQLLERRYKDKLDAKAQKFIDYIVDGALRMQVLIGDLLQYSRVGRQGGSFQLTDCNLVLEEAIANLGSAIRKNQAIVTYSNLPAIVADDRQLVQLFQNLIDNAIKYRRAEKPVVRVSAMELQEEGWLFSVCDNGIGIDSQYAERIFIIFKRLHLREEYPGTGIGLAICKKIVERHGGRIWVESEPGRGSRFNFTLANRGAV